MDHYVLYKQALREKYAAEKLGKHSSFLFSPTAGKLRDLCIQILKENHDQKDRQIFHNFLGFAFQEASIQEVINKKDKFKPIATFLTGDTELADSNSAAADMAAMLIDFQPRPFSSFYKHPKAGTLKTPGSETAPEQTAASIEAPLPPAIQGIVGIVGSQPEPDNKFRKKAIVVLVLVSMAFVTYIVKQEFFPKKNCMQWNNDHYELVLCKGSVVDSLFKPRDMAAREALLHFKKLHVTEKTRFFVNGQPAAWYSKENNVVEFFNAPGKHPVTGKDLRPVTHYMAQQYGIGSFK